MKSFSSHFRPAAAISPSGSQAGGSSQRASGRCKAPWCRKKYPCPSSEDCGREEAYRPSSHKAWPRAAAWARIWCRAPRWMGTARQGQTVGQRGDGQRKASAQFAGEITAGLALPAVQGPEPGPAGGISGLGIQHTDHTALRHIQGPTHAGIPLQTTGQQGQITFAAPPPGFGLAKILHRGVQAVRIIRHGGTDNARRPGIQALQQGPGRRDGALGPQRRDGGLKAAAAAPGQTDAVPACGFEKSLPAPLTGKRTGSFSTGSRIRKNFRESRGKADTVALTDTVGGRGPAGR